MTALIKGTELKIDSGKFIDSLIPTLRTASKTLVPGDDQRILADPTAGTIDFVLPDAVTNPGVVFFIKRVTNSGNVVSLDPAGSDTIENKVSGYMLSLVDEYIMVFSDGTTDWKLGARDILSIATIQVLGGSYAASETPTKFTAWDDAVFSTPKKLEVNLTTDIIEILEFQGPVVDGYAVNVTFNFEFTNNNTVTIQLYAGGSLIGIPVSANAFGTGKPVTLNILENIGLLGLTALELHVTVENANTITNINAKMQIQRLGR